jgi:AraC-like DNA-binding protein
VTVPATTRLLLETPGFQVGEFRCAPSHPLWHQLNDNIGPRPHLVFPQTSVYIDQRGGRVLATPNHVVFYASNELYRRELHDPRGDVSLFVTVDEALLGRIAGVSPLPAHRSSSADTYLAVHVLVRHLLDEARPDTLFVEETLHQLVTQAIRRGVEESGAARAATRRDHRELAEAAKDVLARRLTESVSVHDLARELHVSAFHLSRVFLDLTGFTLHGYRIHLRLRGALEHLREPDADLTRLAHELGFCSLSHFSGSFSRVFGTPPSKVRACSGELRKIVEARLAAAS